MKIAGLILIVALVIGGYFGGMALYNYGHKAGVEQGVDAKIQSACAWAVLSDKLK